MKLNLKIMNYSLERSVDKLQVFDKKVPSTQQLQGSAPEQPERATWLSTLGLEDVFPQGQHTQAHRTVVHGGKAAPLNGGAVCVLLVLKV